MSKSSKSRKKNLNSVLKKSQNCLKKRKAVVILSGEKMGKMGENWSVVTVTIAFCVNILSLLGEKKSQKLEVYKTQSNFLYFIMLRDKFAFTSFRILKNYHCLRVLTLKLISNTKALLVCLLTTVQQLDMCT